MNNIPMFVLTVSNKEDGDKLVTAINNFSKDIDFEIINVIDSNGHYNALQYGSDFKTLKKEGLIKFKEVYSFCDILGIDKSQVTFEVIVYFQLKKDPRFKELIQELEEADNAADSK